MSKKNSRLVAGKIHHSHLTKTVSLDNLITAESFEKLGLPPFEQNDRPASYTIELVLKTPRDVLMFIERLPNDQQEHMMGIITNFLKVEKAVISKWYPNLVDKFSSSHQDYYWSA